MADRNLGGTARERPICREFACGIFASKQRKEMNMNVEELIKQLEKYPKDAKVVNRGLENGLDDLVATKPLKISKRQNDLWNEGTYESDCAGDISAVYLVEEEKDADEFDCE